MTLSAQPQLSGKPPVNIVYIEAAIADLTVAARLANDVAMRGANELGLSPSDILKLEATARSLATVCNRIKRIRKYRVKNEA